MEGSYDGKEEDTSDATTNHQGHGWRHSLSSSDWLIYRFSPMCLTNCIEPFLVKSCFAALSL